MNPMINIYVNLIKNGRKTLDDVPDKIKMAVETALSAAKSNT